MPVIITFLKEDSVPSVNGWGKCCFFNLACKNKNKMSNAAITEQSYNVMTFYNRNR